MTRQEWWNKAIKGTSGDMVFDILRDWEKAEREWKKQNKKKKKEDKP